MTEPGREDALKERQGLPLAAMRTACATSRSSCSRPSSRTCAATSPTTRLGRIREAGVGEIHFAWGGPLDDGHANYWRLHGPLSLVEYDNTQNNANHIHTVWHDLERDFGRDLLREHYATGHHHAHG